MTQSRTVSMELRAIRQQMQESPPPPPTGATVREWFTGLALMNPELMRGLSPEQRVDEAIRLADELIGALAAPRAPKPETYEVPETEEALTQSWNSMAGAMKQAEIKERRERNTVRPGQMRAVTPKGGFRMSPTPPPAPCPTAAEHFQRATEHLQRPDTPMGAFKIPGAGVYSSLRSENNDE